MKNIKQEGWAGDITAKGAKTHYYKDGISLCGKALVKEHMKIFDRERFGSKWVCDCGFCIKNNNLKRYMKNPFVIKNTITK